MIPWYWLLIEPIALFLLVLLAAYVYSRFPYNPNEKFENGQTIEDELRERDSRQD